MVGEGLEEGGLEDRRLARLGEQMKRERESDTVSSRDGGCIVRIADKACITWITYL